MPNDKLIQNRVHIDSFLSYLKDVRGYSEKTVISYGHDLGRLDEFLTSHDLGVEEMAFEDARSASGSRCCHILLFAQTPQHIDPPA